MKKKWSRNEKLTAATFGVALLAILGSYTVPKVRKKLGLEKHSAMASKESERIAPQEDSSAITPQSNSKEKAKTTQRTTVSLHGHGNVAGNNVSGNGNVVGNNNQVNPPAPNIQINSAPNGFAIGGGTVVNPTVNNNYAVQTKPGRTVNDADRINLIAYLSQIKATVSLKAPLGDKEATNYAILWYGILKDARWVMKDRIVLAYATVGGNPEPGAILYVKGEPVQPGGEIPVPNTDPLAYIASALKSQGVPFSLQRDPNQEEGVITIQFGPRPD